MQDPPQTELVRIALDRTNGAEFERFALSFLSAKLGASFIPLGGVHDGGADGLIDDTIFSNMRRPSNFMQASIDKEPLAKIRRTAKRLREVGRTVDEILYVTNQTVARLDLEQENLAIELKVSVRILDGNYIVVQVPTDTGSTSAYYDHLHHQTHFLDGIGRGTVLTKSPHVTDPHVYTYLAGHLERDPTDGSFVDGVVDALIVYALEGTDPDQGILMSENEIQDKIVGILPAARPLLSDRLRDRLEMISRKDGRRIRWHRHIDRWALPYEDRKELATASVEDESLRISVRQELATQFSEITLPSSLHASDLAGYALDTIQLAFEEDGLRFSGFLEDGNLDDSTAFISDALGRVLSANDLKGESRQEAAEAIKHVLRRVFYSSTEKQRVLLQRISRAYGILFALTREPRVLKYFDDAMSSTYLYVGGDIIVDALSERYVQPEDQRTRNLLESARRAGAHLILAAPVLEEVLGHLRASDNEYTNHIEPLDDITYEFARHVPKILVRAYLYSQLLESYGTPESWFDFISQFCRYPDLHREDGMTQLQRYLLNQFGLEFEDWQAIRSKCDDERHRFLATALRTIKPNENLARNDAYIYQLVTHRRSQEGTADYSSEFGYQTWWLSGGEGAAVRAMAQADNGTRRILMRPGFLAKYILLAPSAAETRQSLEDFLPSLLGIKIARRVEEEDFRKMVGTLREAEGLEFGSRASKIADYTDRLRTATNHELDEQWPQATHGEFLPIDLEDLG